MSKDNHPADWRNQTAEVVKQFDEIYKGTPELGCLMTALEMSLACHAIHHANSYEGASLILDRHIESIQHLKTSFMELPRREKLPPREFAKASLEALINPEDKPIQ